HESGRIVGPSVPALFAPLPGVSRKSGFKMNEIRPRSTVWCEWAQVATAFLATAGFVLSIWFSQQSLKLTRDSVELTRTQLDQDWKFHDEDRLNSINPS